MLWQFGVNKPWNHHSVYNTLKKWHIRLKWVDLFWFYVEIAPKTKLFILLVECFSYTITHPPPIADLSQPKIAVSIHSTHCMDIMMTIHVTDLTYSSICIFSLKSIKWQVEFLCVFIVFIILFGNGNWTITNGSKDTKKIVIGTHTHTHHRMA